MCTINLLFIFVFLISLQIYENINPQFPNLTHLIIKRQHFIVRRGGFDFRDPRQFTHPHHRHHHRRHHDVRYHQNPSNVRQILSNIFPSSIAAKFYSEILESRYYPRRKNRKL